MLSSVDCNCGSLGVAADAGVKEVKDLKGKRVGFVVGSPALNQNSLAVLAFGGLTQNDVKVVEFASYGAMWKGLVNNDVDAAFGTTITGPAKEAETSPRGLMWPPLPKSDTAGWERMKKIGSYFFPQLATCGAGISPEKPIELGNYPYPIYVAYASQEPAQVYSIAKAMIDGYDAYKDSAPGAGGLAANRQTKNWVVPVHPGAVKALKEAGQWTAEQEVAQQRAAEAAGGAGLGLGGLQQGQSAIRRKSLSRRLDEDARRGAGQGQHAERVRLGNHAGAAKSATRRGIDDVCSTRQRSCRGEENRVRRSPRQHAGSRGHARAHAARGLALGAGGGNRRHHPALHQPAILAALLHRLHPAQYRIFLSADRADAALHVPDLSGNGERRRSTASPGTICCSLLSPSAPPSC